MAKRKPTEAELELWQQVAKTAKPLPTRRRKPKAAETALAAAAVAKPPALPKKSAKVKTAAAAGTAVKPPAPQQKAHDLSHGLTIGIDRRQADRFRQGKLTIDGKIDLHGRTQAEAHDALH
ncbi:MAG: hypothetical protein ABWY00_07505, partial [Dongiaceae bacterium]